MKTEIDRIYEGTDFGSGWISSGWNFGDFGLYSVFVPQTRKRVKNTKKKALRIDCILMLLSEF